MSTDNATKPVTKEPEERGVLVNDPEIKALAQCDKILSTLDPGAAYRVASYLASKFGRAAEQELFLNSPLTSPPRLQP